jgi:hypothetical protein
MVSRKETSRKIGSNVRRFFWTGRTVEGGKVVFSSRPPMEEQQLLDFFDPTRHWMVLIPFHCTTEGVGMFSLLKGSR